MVEGLLWTILFVVAFAMSRVYWLTRDPLHPLIFIGPMLIYMYALVPAIVFYRGQFHDYIPDEPSLYVALVYTLLGVTVFCLGAMRDSVPPRLVAKWFQPWLAQPRVSQRLAMSSYLLAGVGVGVFLYKLSLVGGLFQAYSMPKGGGASLSSGYFTVAPLLTIPSVMMLFLSKYGKPIKFPTFALALVYASPHLIQGILGGSRGPTFLTIATLGFAWYLARTTRPPVGVLMAALIAVGFLLFFLKANRQEFYLGSEKTVSEKSWLDMVVPLEKAKDHPGIYSLGLITARDFNQHCLWGRGYVTHLLVRPVPKQWWPNKYTDMGMEWMKLYPGSAGMLLSQWRTALGWEPNAGTAAGFVSDTFLQLSWWGLSVCFLMGRLYGWLWKKAVTTRGLWSILYFYACVVSIYLPTQGLGSAWAYRFLYMAVPTVLLWYLIIPQWQHAHPRGPLPPSS